MHDSCIWARCAALGIIIIIFLLFYSFRYSYWYNIVIANVCFVVYESHLFAAHLRVVLFIVMNTFPHENLDEGRKAASKAAFSDEFGHGECHSSSSQ